MAEKIFEIKGEIREKGGKKPFSKKAVGNELSFKPGVGFAFSNLTYLNVF